MSALNSRLSQDPRWTRHHRTVVEGWMSADVVIERQQGVPVWDPVSNDLISGSIVELWRGAARVQGNKDWRVRNIQSASDPQFDQFVRVQIPLDGANPPPRVEAMDIIRVVPPDDPNSQWYHDPDLEFWTMRVRNTVNSSNPWLRNILAVIDVTETDQPRPEAAPS